ncbi:hypothetical protein BLNAU_8997 [Blattamonas nauphoetae]|uniref:Uncharacterized protein n=1 Tax=Blattamonas nauphoetae TaxID=2049346 RepID=A0ABQ9XX22_9EUKA|nr:hypothetical protein BLNAU_8997 [Blattamonas nauphoetae]
MTGQQATAKAMRCLPAPTNLVRPATYNIFRDNIIPAWEDPGNVGGGRIRVFGQSKQGQPDLKYDQRNMMNQLFVDFLLCIIGGELDNAHVFTGLILDPHKPLLEFWFGKNEEEPETILSTISSKLRILVDQRDFFQPENFKVELKPFS